MKYGVNKATLVGNVGDTPKFNEKDGEIFLASFPFATSETFKDKSGNEVTNTQWHRVKVWNKKAGVVKQLVNKGDSLYIEGKIVNSSWDDKDGNRHYSSEIECDNFLYLRPKKAEDNSAA